MLDIKLIRKDPDLVKDSMRRRGMDPTIVDHLLILDSEWRSLVKRLSFIRHQKKQLERQIAESMKEKDGE